MRDETAAADRRESQTEGIVMNRFIVAFGVLTFQVDATDQQAAKDGAREQFRALLHREPVIGPCIIDWAPLT